MDRSYIKIILLFINNYYKQLLLQILKHLSKLSINNHMDDRVQNE